MWNVDMGLLGWPFLQYVIKYSLILGFSVDCHIQVSLIYAQLDIHIVSVLVQQNLPIYCVAIYFYDNFFMLEYL